jgi:hypothetical protein
MSMQQQVQYDNKGQLDRIVPHIFQGETLVYVFDLKGSGTGFLGVTDKRLIFVDQDFLGRKDSALISVPYARISYCAIQTDAKWIGRDTSSVTVAVTGRTFDFAFNGVQKAHQIFQVINYHICR